MRFRGNKGEISQIRCKTAAKWLQFYLDGELSDTIVQQRVTYHLERCKNCGLEAETYTQIKTAISIHARDLDKRSIDRLSAFIESLD
ncbi:MAG: zf-HC2 domain-containing protein [Acidimicrobiaceae bacterium]|nr:zf-HC2 domain-containing protein [Acidimicrobiaceae bacterium]